MPISATIIADSINTHGNRLTTFVLSFPQIVVKEFLRHRSFSNNSASQRAIPFEKNISYTTDKLWYPRQWTRTHKGMQGFDYFTEDERVELDAIHLETYEFLVKQATRLHSKGVSKQLVNRYIEQFGYVTMITTATEWENFFALRAHDAAEIHIQDLAYKMLDAYNASEPKLLQPGEWHIPFGDQFDEQRLIWGNFEGVDWPKQILEWKLKIATARCARISYNNFEGKDDYVEDIKLHDRLLAGGHMSPFEHCAKALDYSDRYEPEVLTGNFRGFIQYRKLLKGENKSDGRVIKK